MTEIIDDMVGAGDEILTLTTEIVAAYAARNQMAQTDLPNLIQTVHSTLAGLAGMAPEVEEEEPVAEAPLVPAVPIDASVTQDAIICLEDGKSFKTLKRHLRTAYDMSPEEYRERWGLSKDYPMVAPSYSAKRAETAKKIGLGRKPKK
ncbi:MucR family transcriptional regulator [Psychromarinibacter halotolerans]|mgnify:FL=1|uniref:MucR family transcriptional regulator n=1 Tax=Psychromarinibacter halotolerans TaxID=1775175 RepID=A0ABV7GLK3_9RHOB|nr:MucR family transcriptional regulator [Psychromarinibacter halotolerans]MAQ84551.1 MucR family transcriptional regulator [Maritimibacter sp.]MAQ84585.1 MucR family transcriptional regulator [Maritimibacter sp.]MDF0598922.1 MucR family transcriptional regulator [Psychromarinibacter halotolerans]|tara:strand:- start:123 stop:566 length:444 start_codon:yes stop_codon:yes gene_type:complete